MSERSVAPAGDYVLGTRDDEIERLGLQHRLWRHRMLDCWRRARIRTGQRVADIGAGPGYATAELADAVGPGGAVYAFERSERFLAAMRARFARDRVAHVTLCQIDLDTEPLAVGGLDATWCRWVLSFVQQPARVVEQIAAALRPGGHAVFHEYVDYGAWRLHPPLASHDTFVAAVVASWRASGGEPDIGMRLPGLLAAAGLEIEVAEPVSYLLTPADPLWEWPAAYVQSGRRRLVELGYLTPEQSLRIDAEFAAAATAPETRMLTPMLVEIIAVKPDGTKSAR